MVNIHGSCVTRDAMEMLISKNQDYSIEKYVSRNSLFSVLCDPLSLDESEFTEKEGKAFLKRMVLTDFRKDMFRSFSENRSDYLIIDLVDERFDLLSFYGEEKRVITYSSNFAYSDILNSHSVYSRLGYTIIDTADFSDGLVRKAVNEYARRILEIYPSSRIIIHKAFLSGNYLGLDNKHHSFPDASLKDYSKINNKLSTMYGYLIEALGVDEQNVISVPDARAWEGNKWGLAPFHYTEDYYAQVCDRIVEITGRCAELKARESKSVQTNDDVPASRENIREHGLLGKISRYRFLFEELVKRDFNKKYKRTVLGMLWSILGPLMTLGVMAMVFTQFFGRNVEHYIIYMFCGNVLFNFFKEATSTGMTSLANNAQIFSKINVPKYMFLLSRNVSSWINLGINICVLFTFCLIDGVTLSWKVVTLVYPIACIMLFSLGIGLILSALYIMFRDMKYLYDVFTLMLMYVSAIFYSTSSYPEDVQKLFYINPLYIYISYFRKVILERTIPSLPLHLIGAAYALCAMLAGMLIYKKQNYKFLYYL